MTSPVERISGPRIVSTPWKRSGTLATEVQELDLGHLATRRELSCRIQVQLAQLVLQVRRLRPEPALVVGDPGHRATRTPVDPSPEADSIKNGGDLRLEPCRPDLDLCRVL